MKPKGRRVFAGNSQRKALALHCMMGSSAGWGGVAEQLGGDVELTALDLPAHGQGPVWEPSNGTFTPLALATARDAAEELASPRVDLIGHSFGAVVALALAVEMPQMVRSLTLIEPVLFAALPDDQRDPDGLLDDLHKLEARNDQEGATAAFLKYWNGPNPASLPQLKRDQLVMQMVAVMDTMDDLYLDRLGILKGGRLEAIAAPVTLISGEASATIIAPIMSKLRERIVGAEHIVIPEAAHMAPLTHAAQVGQVIVAALQRAG